MTCQANRQKILVILVCGKGRRFCAMPTLYTDDGATDDGT
ncbi:putative terminase small subunit [Salmonella phage 41]|nr:putative terminase small subunit [Salmonella phage 41]